MEATKRGTETVGQKLSYSHVSFFTSFLFVLRSALFSVYLFLRLTENRIALLSADSRVKGTLYAISSPPFFFFVPLFPLLPHPLARIRFLNNKPRNFQLGQDAARPHECDRLLASFSSFASSFLIRTVRDLNDRVLFDTG